jgi:transketolase
VFEKPTVIIANTIPGMGVSFMENKVDWHGKVPSSEQAKKAMIELKTLQGRINKN